MRMPTTRKLPGGAGRAAARGQAAAAKEPAVDLHPADSRIRVACLPDPVKVVKKAGYPKRSVQDRLEECGMQYTQIGVRDVLDGRLTTDAYDVLCIPGGYAPNWCDKLGSKGSKAIKDFVAQGGGFVGICAGAYLGSTWDLGLIDVDLPLIDRWARGKTDACNLQLTEAAGLQLGEVGAMSRLVVRYSNGPLMQANGGVAILATFGTELRGRRNKYPAEMKGTAAIVSGRYHGKAGTVGGNVVLISPHPEAAGGSTHAHNLFRQLFRRAAGVLDPKPEPKSKPGRTVRVGEFALARQRSGCSCCEEDEKDELESQSEPEPEPEPELGQLPPPRGPQVDAVRADSGVGAEQVDRTALAATLPVTMADGYSVQGLAYVESAGSPILFTAPHGLQVYRGGQNGERRRLHLRERWSTEIALKLAAAAPTEKCASFIVWNHKTAKKKDNNNLDPNYLTAEQQAESPFHRGLIRFKQRDYGAMPRFHIDVHGKIDRKTNLDLDVGLGPMEQHWDEDGMDLLKEQLEQGFHAVFADCQQFRSRKKGSVGQLSFGVEVDPRLHGYWGTDTVMTMSHQAIAEGIAAIQLEIPYTMREQLMRDEGLFDRFATAIYAAYDAVVATEKIGDADGSVVGPEIGDNVLQRDPPSQQLDRDTIGRMLEECKMMDIAMAGRERMI
eukprot:COSAG02_NODE_336_length_24344_cov_63.239101_17_plen_669_part_00